MRLFKRSTPPDDAVRCPECGERAPRGADECAMCGHDLAAVQPASADGVADPRSA